MKTWRTFYFKYGAYYLAACLTFFVSPTFLALPTEISRIVAFNLALAQENQSSQNSLESYLTRPNILDVQPQEHHFDENWKNLKAAHFSFVAELLEMYPKETHLYFLARDSEYLYDVARLVTEGTEDSSRIHLLNVSRANMEDTNLKPYLKENGISEASLRLGKKVLFVDTGFAGTIPNVIAKNFPEELRSQLKTHLITSSNPKMPSSRAFLVHLNPLANEKTTSSLHGTILNYEFMPRYTNRSDSYVMLNGQYHPMSSRTEASEGIVSQELSLRYMKDLKHEWQKAQTQERFRSTRKKLKEVIALLNQASESAIERIRNALQKGKGKFSGRLLEAQIRDLIESGWNTGLNIQVILEDLDLKQIDPSHYYSKKENIIKNYPQWSAILDDPEVKIPQLFKSEKWQIIGNLIDANIDSDFNLILATSLYDQPAVGIKKKYQILFLRKGNPDLWLNLIRDVFSQPQAEGMEDLIKILIEIGGPVVWRNLAQEVFSKPHTAGMEDAIRLLITKQDPKTWMNLATSTFPTPHGSKMKNLIRILIEQGDAITRQSLALYTFSQRNAPEMKDLIKLLIEKGGPEAWVGLKAILSQSHMQGDAEFEVFKETVNLVNVTLDERIAWMNQKLQKMRSPLATTLKIEVSCKMFFMP